MSRVRYPEAMARRGAYAKGLAKREEILDAALRVVAEHGYRKASVREIADAVELSPAGLLHYFGSKEELFVAILAARDARDEDRLGSEDIVEGLLEIVGRNTAVPGLVQLYAQLAAEAADPEHPAREFFTHRTARLEGYAIAELETAQRAGRIRDDLDPAWIIRSVHAMADGLQTAWLIDRDIDMAADLRRFIALLEPTSGSRGAS